MEFSRVQPPQSPLAYMRAQPVPPMAAYDDYRRNSSSSSSYGYSDRGNREWGAYSSPASRHSEMAWSSPPSHHHHHHHGSRQDAGTSSSPSRSMPGENSPSQAQYLSGYVATHSNSRYRPGYWSLDGIRFVFACLLVFLYQNSLPRKIVTKSGWVVIALLAEVGRVFMATAMLDCYFCSCMETTCQGKYWRFHKKNIWAV